MQMSLVQIQPAHSAPSADLIGSLVRARAQCTPTDTCPSNLPDPIQPALAATLRSLRGGVASGVLDLLGRRRLSCTGFTNPVVDSDFADPSEPIVGEDGLLYAYATNSMGFNIQVWKPSSLLKARCCAITNLFLPCSTKLCLLSELMPCCKRTTRRHIWPNFKMTYHKCCQIQCSLMLQKGISHALCCALLLLVPWCDK